jgi:hypothetical protein
MFVQECRTNCGCAYCFVVGIWIKETEIGGAELMTICGVVALALQ